MNRALLNQRMAKNVEPKLEFLKFPQASGVTLWVDYGCADGAVTKVLANSTEAYCFGYDRIFPQVENEKANLFFHDTLDVLRAFKGRCTKVGVFVGSLFHEAYTEGVTASVWKDMREIGADVIFVRDMVYWGRMVPEPYPVNVDTFKGHHLWQSFRDYWCKEDSDITWHDYLHFLLKYRFVENWDHELRENYLSINPDALEAEARRNGYECTRRSPFGIPFLAARWKKDFGVDLDVPTHGWFVFEKEKAHVV